ncbi:MAG TPA: hypothetical protein PLU64_03630, partial [Saprospiraceae bacterium]|nr:hypothetical protein [Saprospiraceae bacterium]
FAPQLMTRQHGLEALRKKGAHNPAPLVPMQSKTGVILHSMRWRHGPLTVNSTGAFDKKTTANGKRSRGL